MNDGGESTLGQDDARNSIEVLHGIQRMTNQLGAYQFEEAPVRQARLVIEGVEVSIHADLLLTGTNRAGDELVGAVVPRMTQSDASSDVAMARWREMGLSVAILVRARAEANLAGNRTLPNRLCMSIDVQQGEIFVPPASVTRRMNDITHERHYRCLPIHRRPLAERLTHLNSN